MLFFASLAAVCSELAGSLLSVVYKNLRDAGVSTWAVGATAVYAAPFLLCAGFVLFFLQDVRLSWFYASLVLSWFVANIAHNFLRIFASKHHALSAFMVWELAISSALFFAVDVLFFDLPLSWWASLGVLLAVVGVHLAQSSADGGGGSEATQASALRNLRAVAVFVAIVVVTAISASLSKAAVSEQDTLFHAAAANGVLLLIYGALGWRPLSEARAAGHIANRDLVVLTTAMVVLCFLEAFAFKHLPLVAVRLIAVMVPFLVFTVVDVRKGRLSHNVPQMAFGLAVAFVGLGLFAISFT